MTVRPCPRPQSFAGRQALPRVISLTAIFTAPELRSLAFTATAIDNSVLRAVYATEASEGLTKLASVY